MTINATPIHVNIHAANRLANTIRSFKWVVIVTQALTGLLMILVVNGINSVPAWLSLPVALGTLVAAITSWVLLGWFEHTLRLLVKIADNS